MMINYVEFLTKDFPHPVLSRKHDKGHNYITLNYRLGKTASLSMMINYVEFLTQDFPHPVLSRKHDKGDYHFDIICRIKCEE